MFNTDKVASLHAKSNGALSVLKKMVSTLTTIDGEIQTEIEAGEAKAAIIAAKNTELSTLKAENSKVVNKLQETFGI